MDESFESTASEPSPQASSAKPLVSSIGSMSELFYTGIYSKCTTTIHQIDSKEKR